jgi:uncharacterized OsmC-like protein
MRLPNILFHFVSVANFFNMSSSFATFSFHRSYGNRICRTATKRIVTPTAKLLLPCVLARGTIFSYQMPAVESFTTTTTCLLAAKVSTHDITDVTPPSSASLSNSSSTAKAYQLDGFGVAGGTKVEATTGTGHSISTDIPKSMGGGDTAPQPVETLLGAWMGCTQATASFVGRQLLMERPRNNEPSSDKTTASGRPRRRRPPRTEILLEFDNIEAYRDSNGALELPIRKTPSTPSRLQRITGTIKVSLVQHAIEEDDLSTATPAIFLNPEELEVLKEQTENRCPIANMMVASGCAMEVEWIQEKNDL